MRVDRNTFDSGPVALHSGSDKGGLQLSITTENNDKSVTVCAISHFDPVYAMLSTVLNPGIHAVLVFAVLVCCIIVAIDYLAVSIVPPHAPQLCIMNYEHT